MQNLSGHVARARRSAGTGTKESDLHAGIGYVRGEQTKRESLGGSLFRLLFAGSQFAVVFNSQLAARSAQLISPSPL
jgi:hypothetical protein